MLQVFSKDTSALVLDNASPDKNIAAVNAHIKLCKCKNMTVDITRLNVMDACAVSALCSTEHFMKYPDGEINWVVNSKDVEHYTSSMQLGNCRFTYGR